MAPLTPRRPSQAVSESKTLSPEGNHLTITMERVSTGGTRYAAQFKRSSAGAMNDAERRKKARVRASLFPEKRAESLRTDAERKHTSRTSRAHDADSAELDAESDAESDADSDADSDDSESDAYSTSNCSEADRLEDRIMYRRPMPAVCAPHAPFQIKRRSQGRGN
jgi:predicted DNA-binding WGR domain protein